MKIQNNGKYNLICSECKEPFFTDEEKVYYIQHNYLFRKDAETARNQF